MRKIVKISWIDSTIHGPWLYPGDNVDIFNIVSVGLLIDIKETVLEIALSESENAGSIQGMLQIPKGCIYSAEVLTDRGWRRLKI